MQQIHNHNVTQAQDSGSHIQYLSYYEGFCLKFICLSFFSVIWLPVHLAWSISVTLFLQASLFFSVTFYSFDVFPCEMNTTYQFPEPLERFNIKKCKDCTVWSQRVYGNENMTFHFYGQVFNCNLTYTLNDWFYLFSKCLVKLMHHTLLNVAFYVVFHLLNNLDQENFVPISIKI